MTWTIDNAFAGANATGIAIDTHRGAAALSCAADPRQGPEALWFRVRLRRLASGSARPWLILRHVGSLLGGGDGAGIQPVARADHGPWRRLERGEPIIHADGRGDAAWLLPEAAAAIEVALCLPYGDEELIALQADGGAALRVAPIGTSEGGRPLLRLSTGDGAVGSTRAGLYLLARQHAGESPGSWVLDGLLRRLAGAGADAPLAWAIPFVDVDGVATGAYGKDRHPVDYNRSWWRMGRRHEVQCIMRDIGSWRKRCAPRLCLDLHAPGALEREGCYGYLSIGGHPANPEAAAWSERIAQALGPGFAAEPFSRHADYPSRWPRDTHPSFGSWATDQGLAAISLEIPYQGKGDSAWNAAEYREIGARIADALS
jgi:hypothetical protein